MKAPISIFILTFNEEKNIEACLKSVTGWASEVVIIDSFSTDKTLALAEKYGVRVLQHKFESFGAQRNWALANAHFKEEWLMTLDADHRVTPELAEELKATLKDVPRDVEGLYVKRRQIFWGKWIRYGGYYPKYLLKVFRSGTGKFDPLELDDRVYVKGRTEKLKNDIIEQNLNEDDISFFIEKHTRYAKKLAEEELYHAHAPQNQNIEGKLFGHPNQQSHWRKNVWRSLPPFVRPVAYFIYRYFFRCGFLDGKEGFIFHTLQAFWFRLLVDINLEQLKRRNLPAESRRAA